MDEKMKMIVAIAVVGAVCFGAGYLVNSGGGAESTTLKLEGSTTLTPLMELYAEKFEQYNPGVRIEIVSNGSQNGVNAANSGLAHIGLSSRAIDHPSHAGLTQTFIGKDTVVIIAGSGTGVTNLTKAQVEGIYSGTHTNWNQVGGSNQEIVPIDRDEGSGTRSFFEEYFDFTRPGSGYAAMAATGQVIEFVKGNAGAIAYVSLGSLMTDADKALALDLDSVSPFSDTYGLQRDLVLLTKEKPTGLTAVFISWILGDEGRKIMDDAGFMPRGDLDPYDL